MLCKNCGEYIWYAATIMAYVHMNDGMPICDLPRTHPSFMMVSATPEDD